MKMRVRRPTVVSRGLGLGVWPRGREDQLVTQTHVDAVRLSRKLTQGLLQACAVQYSTLSMRLVSNAEVLSLLFANILTTFRSSWYVGVGDQWQIWTSRQGR